MSIYIVDGKIGAGKTYYCIYYILKRYYDFDSSIKEYFPKKNIILVTNVDGLQLEHISLVDEVARLGLNSVFSAEYVNSLRDQNRGCQIVFLIDETQQTFDRKFYSKEIFGLFQYSRHYGLDILLVTQDADSVVKEIRTLAEYSIRAVRRSFVLGSSFRYKKVIDNETFSSFSLPKIQRVFNQYRSFVFAEGEAPKSVYPRFIIIGVFFLVLALLAFKFVYLDFFFGSTKSIKDLSITKGLKSSHHVTKPVDDMVKSKSGVFLKRHSHSVKPSGPSPVRPATLREKKDLVSSLASDLPVSDIDHDRHSSGFVDLYTCALVYSVASEEVKKDKFKCKDNFVYQTNGKTTQIRPLTNREGGGAPLAPTPDRMLSGPSGGLIYNGNN